MKIRALIFDFDGLLVNTEELIHESYEKFFAKRGIKVSYESLVPFMGKPIIFNMAIIREKYGFLETPEELVKERNDILFPLVDKRVRLMKGAKELLERARRWGLKLGIASGARHSSIGKIANRLGIMEYFSAIAATEDLVKSQGKPDPEIFLIAAQKLGVEPSECIAIGDAPNDMAAAKEAGMKTIFIPDPRFIDPKNDQADLILKSLKDLTRDVLEGFR